MTVRSCLGAHIGLTQFSHNRSNKMTARQRQQEALKMARQHQGRGLIERMAQRAVVRQQQEELARAEQRRRQGR